MARRIGRLFAVILLLFCSHIYAQTGHVAHGVGAINQSMAGAGTAMPLDATGALFWNPASITDLKSSEVDVNGDIVRVDSDLSSTVAPNALGPGIPPRTLLGTSPTDATTSVLASIAWVHRPKYSRWSYGVFAATIGGFGFDFKNNGQNPITTPPPPNGIGLGDIFTKYLLVQAAPSFAYEINDHLSVGIAPSVGVSTLKVNPFPFTSPDDANHDGFPTYPRSNTQVAVGGGAQGGLYYKTDGWHLGVSVKSPLWFNAFKFDSHNEVGEPRSFKFTLNYPMIVTTGIGYSGFEKFTFAADVRFIDYENTKGFGQTGFDPTGAVRGLGWRNIWVFATGMQFAASDRLSIRGGYGFNGNPIRDAVAFFNVGSALVTQHQANAGFSYRVKEHAAASFAYHHAFENDITGPFLTPLGPVPGTSVRPKFGTDFFVLSLNLKFE
jgi:long-chain fatty acid transport protein